MRDWPGAVPPAYQLRCYKLLHNRLFDGRLDDPLGAISGELWKEDA